MESPSISANSVAMSDSSSINDEEMVRPSPEPRRSGEGKHAFNSECDSSTPGALNPSQDLPVANADEVCAHRCKYCDKRFSSQQALGGHQNAHKTERAMERSARELQQNQFALHGGPSSFPVMASSPTFPVSFNVRSHEYLNRPMFNIPFHLQQPVHQGMHIGHCALPVPGVPYASHHLYPGWHVHMPRIPQYMVPRLHVPYNTPNPGFPPMGMGSSSAHPVAEAHPDFTGSQHIPDRDPGGQYNQMNNSENQEVEDQELDLTLRL